jgi:putative methyltransferase (TIGR04325 family)
MSKRTETSLWARRWLPPGFLEFLKPILGRAVYYSGNFSEWPGACERATGYDSEVILEKVCQARLKVAAGEARFERDGVLFDHVQHSFPVLAALFRAAIEDHNQLSILDFGGSLGSSYFQCRDFLSIMPRLSWAVVEQPHFVRCGKQYFENAELRFFHGVGEAVVATRPNVVLFSSVLQYLPEPWKVIDELIGSAIRYIVIDRTPFTETVRDLITIQHVPPSIYPATYPCRIFARQAFLDRLRTDYEILAAFNSDDGSAQVGGTPFTYGGMILRKL